MSILIKNISHNRSIVDVLIEGNRFSKIAPKIKFDASVVIDGSDKAILPGFYNLHTHAAMNLLKGLGDDKELQSWLSEDIWPREEKFDDEIIYWGTKLAILEMIRSGIIFFSDMYFEQGSIMKAVAEMGVRAAVSVVGFDLFDENLTKEKIKAFDEFLVLNNPAPERIIKAISIHAVYTTSKEIIEFAVKKAKENNMFLHIHACETRKEVDDCLKEHGCSPIEYLEKMGAISEKTILAHAVHLSEKDVEIIVKNKVKLITNPSSNHKLASGVFDFQKLTDAGCLIGIGCDGSASNNALNMFFEMKLCALAAKIKSQDPKAGKAEYVFEAATRNGAEIFGLDSGAVAVGKLADCILVDLNNSFLVPNYNLISNMVYAADTSVVDTVICDGNILMQNKIIEGEKEIIKKAREMIKKF